MRSSVGEAFRNLYGNSYEPLLAYSTRLAGASLAEDIVQEVFVRVLRYRGEQLELVTMPYLRAIARNVATTMFSRRGLTASVPEGDIAEPAARRGAYDRADGSDEAPRRAIAETLDVLPERQREVLILTECHGLSESQVGVALSISKAAVGSRRRLALDSLRRRVDRPPPRALGGGDVVSTAAVAYGRTA